MEPFPDLPGDQDIVADHIRAVQAIWFAQRLEGLRFFDVGDRIVERFQQGLLPLGQGSGRRLREHLAGSASAHLSTTGRQTVVARTLGLPGGDAPAPASNRDFQELWLRFIGSVSAFRRQPTTGLATGLPLATSRRAVWQSARALARRLSAWGSGGPFFAAQELARDVNRLRDLLQDATVLRAFGARDMWGVIDQVAGTELGGASNVVRHRERAVAGSTLLQWLADHADALQRQPEPPADTEMPDAALRRAVAQWLALAEAEAAPKPSLRAGTTRAGATAAAPAKASLGRVASRYLGETEKNLDAVFARVKDSSAVLLFDEADALFSRRTEVKDAHDRFADAGASPAPPAPPPAPAAAGAKGGQPPSTRRISRP